MDLKVKSKNILDFLPSIIKGKIEYKSIKNILKSSYNKSIKLFY